MISRFALLLVWVVPAFAAVVLTAFVFRREGGWRWRAAFLASGSAGGLTVAAWAVARCVGWLDGRGLVLWLRSSQGSSEDALVDAAFRIGLGATLAFAIGLPWGARRIARESVAVAPLHPLAAVAAGLALIGAFVAPATFAGAPVQLEALCDLLAVVPLLAIGLALYLLAPLVPEVEPLQTPTIEAQPTAHPSPSYPDPEPVLRRAGLLRVAAPDFDSRSTTSIPATDPAGRIWIASGGDGSSPDAIAAVLDRVGTPSPGLLVGDLAIETERAFVVALLALASAERAMRALVICADAESVTSSVLRVLEELGVPRPGRCVARLGALKDALARGETPALVCLGLGEFSGDALQLLGTQPLPWLSGVDLVVIVRGDRLPPIESTHIAFTLRRLAIAVETNGAAPLWIAIGEGSLGARRFIEQAVGRSFEVLRFGARATAATRVFLRRGQIETIAREAEAWGRALTQAHVEVHIEDAIGALGERAVDVAGDRRRAAHRPGYQGRCALALLDDRHLAGLFRSRGQLAHRIGDGRHFGVWWVKDSPLARFLVERGTLAALERDDLLPSPRPLAGTRNRYVAAWHLEAALHEGRPDEAALRRAFGDPAVDDLLAARADVRFEGERARFTLPTRTIERTRILTRPGARATAERRETVTQNVVEVRGQHNGELLRQVDQRVAQTRFYPHRVFHARGSVYRVGESSAGSAISVSLAEKGAVPTIPELSFQIKFGAWLGEIETHQLAQVTLARGVASVTVQEAVTGAIPRGSAAPSVRYAPVKAEYESVAAVLMFERVPSPAALEHVGRVIDLVLPAHLATDDEDIEVRAYPTGFAGITRPALVFIDRQVGGIGVAEALDARTVNDLLRWTWGVLHSCACMNGCKECTPPEVLARGPDKQGALQLLGGSSSA